MLKSCAEATAAKAVAPTVPRKIALSWMCRFIFPPVSVLVRDDDFVAARFDFQAENVAGGVGECGKAGGRHRAVHRQTCDGSIGNHDLLLVVAVQFARHL